VVWPSAGAYRAAIADPTRFEHGWVVLAKTDDLAGSVLVQRDGQKRVVAPPELTPEDPRGLALAPGQFVRVDALASRESGGFWHVWSAPWQAHSPEQFERIYFRVLASKARTFARCLVKHLPPHPAWAMKILCGQHEAGRRDNSLLYVPAGTALQSGWLTPVLHAVGELCTGQLPPFVQPLHPGIGWAPDPGGGCSFGEAVSEIVANAVDLIDDPFAFAVDVRARVCALPGMSTSRKQEESR
jgi:hypothetical protein